MTWALLAALVLTIACGAPDQADTGSIAEWTLEQDLFIGGEDVGPKSFADIRGLAVDDWGRMYVLEAQTYQVRVFDSTGAVVRVIGRQGSGPGEFGEPNGLALARNGDIWVYDPNEHRVTVFDSSGKLDRIHAISVFSWSHILEGGLDSAGRFYDQQLMRTDTGMVRVMRRSDFARGLTDTLPLPPCSAPFTPWWDIGDNSMSVPYSTGLYMSVDPRGVVWCGDTREVRVARYELGDTVPEMFLRAPVTPAPVTEEARAVAIERVERFKERSGAPDAAVDYSRIPDVMPVLLSVDLDRSGRAWVRVQTDRGDRVLVFDSIGRQVAAAGMPVNARWLPLVVRDDHVYVITTDSLDVPGIVRLRVDRGE